MHIFSILSYTHSLSQPFLGIEDDIHITSLCFIPNFLRIVFTVVSTDSLPLSELIILGNSKRGITFQHMTLATVSAFLCLAGIASIH